jgi:hypothetical protein
VSLRKGKLGAVLMMLIPIVPPGLVHATVVPPAIRIVTPGTSWPTLLLTYLLGAATTLAVQLVIQLVVVPRVETRKRREDRWERNVLQLAELLATDLASSASAAKVAQLVCQDLREMAADPSADQAKIARRLPEMLTEARHATNAFRDIAHTRVGLLTRQIERLSPTAEDAAHFSGASRRYWLRVATVAMWHADENAPEAELEERWDQEYKARTELIAQVTRLDELPHPPRAPLRRRLTFWNK